MNPTPVLGSPENPLADAMTTPQVVRFGTFELDRSTGELRSQGKRVALQDQPAQVLSLLVSRPGEVVTREDLCRALWSEDTFVEFDTALNVAVNKVRQALRDSATSPRFIETIPRRGYRFLSDVHPVADTPAAPAVSHRPRLRWAIGIALGLLLAAVAIGVGERFVRPSASPQSVAVLPFKPLIAGSRDEALEMGLAESVIGKLGQRQGLRVPSISAVRRYGGSAPNPRQAGRELGVDTVLDGSLLRAEGRLRVSARLLDVDTGTTRWAQQWNIPWTDVFMVEDAMATEVTRVLAPALGPGERVPNPKPPTNAAAYDRYLRGRYLVTQRTRADSQRAAELLEEAVALDPHSAAAQAVLADAYVAVTWFDGSMGPFVERARQAALRSLELDPNEATAHATLGILLALFDWDTASGERELQRALELGPDEPAVLRFNAVFLYYSRRYEDCITQSLKALELDRYFASVYSWLGACYEHLGREREAVNAYITPLTFGDEHQKEAAALRAAAAKGGLRGYWTCRLDQIGRKPEAKPEEQAIAALKVGDRDQAIGSLERLSEQRGPWLRIIKIDPQWDPLRADPRFQALLRKARLADPS
jgi:DNA-binding winged helix-turn-helix (wHTH) protein/TolB-like protein/tetratricopeptide (TPR) repeat protein